MSSSASGDKLVILVTDLQAHKRREDCANERRGEAVSLPTRTLHAAEEACLPLLRDGPGGRAVPIVAEPSHLLGGQAFRGSGTFLGGEVRICLLLIGFYSNVAP